MITELGKLLRKYRIDLGVNLGEMAKAIDISPAFLSSIETGKRDINRNLIEKLIVYLKLDHSAALDLEILSAKLNQQMVINVEDKNDEQIRTFTMLARSISDLDSEQLDIIRSTINRTYKDVEIKKS